MKSKTIANIIHCNTFPLRILDSNGNEVYYCTSHGYSCKSKFDGNDEIYCEDSHGYWWNAEYDDKGERIYIKNCDGVIKDKR